MPSLDKKQKPRPKKIVEPDVTKLGGQVLDRREDRITIHLPPGKAKELRDDPNVAYMQRIWTGEPFEEWAQEEGSSSSSSRWEVESDAPSLEWKAGPYQYDASGNIKAIKNSGGTDDTYEYDTLGRLVKAVVNGETETYCYDAFGNLLEKTITGKTPELIPVDPANNRINNEAYDAAGNLTTNRGATTAGVQYEWDSVGMLVTVSAGTSRKRMVYTADDERIGVELGGEGRWVVRDFGGKALREFSGNLYQPDQWLWSEDYIYADGRLVAGSREDYYGGRRHFHTDHLGSVRMTTRETDRMHLGRHDYFPFGNEQTPMLQEVANFTQRPEQMKFTGHQRDYLGSLVSDNKDLLDYMHARYYNPFQGRFLSPDPVLDLEEAMHEPQLWNRYAYVTNNPLKFTDPDGRYRTFYKEKPMTGEKNLAMDENTPAVVKGAFYIQGALLGEAAGEVLGGWVGGVVGRFVGRLLGRADNVVDGARAVNRADEIAAEGGKHSGTLRNYIGRSATEVAKGVRGHEKQVALHLDKLKNPRSMWRTGESSRRSISNHC